jgi:soluble lytic murein transglycosylase-like protein
MEKMKKLTFLAAIVAAGISALAFAPAQAETAAADTKLDEIKTASIAKPGQQFASIISRLAKEHGVPVALAHAVIQVESSYRPDARGSAGEIGLMQIKPATARMMGYKGSDKGLYDPETNIRYGMKYLGKARSLSDGSTCGTILKYNAGHGAKRMNPISRNYCNKVEKILAIGS